MESLNDYLNAKDWVYSFNALEGEEGGYAWIQTKDLMVDPLTAITLPNPFKILILDFGGSPGAESFANKAGWTAIGEYAASPVLMTRPDLPLHEAIFIVYDQAAAPQLEATVTKHQLYCHREPYEEELPLLAANLKELGAFLYFGNIHGIVFCCKLPTMNELKSSQQFHGLAEAAKDQVRRRRDRMWQQMGPEVGPELCAEDGCEHKRIQLTPRCFVHQMKMQGK